MGISRVGGDRPYISRTAGGTAKLTPVGGQFTVPATTDAATAALIPGPSSTATALTASIDAAAATLTVAASNSLAGRAADFRCDGTDDQNTINAAIAALPTAGGRVKLLAGEYSLSGAVVINRSHVDLEGESHMMWGGYNTSYGANSGNEGSSGAKLKATASGFNLIELAWTGGTDGGETRHRGIRVSYLYLFGYSYNNRGVNFQSNHDLVHIDHLTCHKLEYGVYSTGDASFIHHNNIQDCVNGVYYINGNGQVTNNIIWDCSGTGLIVGASELAPVVVSANNIGNCVLEGIEALGPCVITGNEIVHCKRNQVWLRTIGGAAVTGNVIRGNSYTPAANGVKVDTHGNTVSGNTIRALAATTGKAVSLASTAVRNAVGGNVIQGSWASPPVSLGMGNKIEGNTGFSTSASGAATSVADGGTIAHGLLYTPTSATVSGTVAGQIVTVTSIDATNITVAVKTGAGSAGTAQTVHWSAKIDSPYVEGPAAQTSGALVGWYKADALSLSDGDSVSSWLDSTAVGTALAPNTTAPVFKTGIINSKPVVRFNGSANAMISTLFPSVPQPFTVFIVAKQITGGSAQTLLGARNGGGLSQTVSAYLSSSGAPSGYANGAGAVGPTVTTTNPHVYEWVFAGGSSMAGADGTVNTGGSGASGMGGGITIGANGNASPGEFYNGDIAEVLVYMGALSSTDCSAVRAALGTKYAITVI